MAGLFIACDSVCDALVIVQYRGPELYKEREGIDQE